MTISKPRLKNDLKQKQIPRARIIPRIVLIACVLGLFFGYIAIINHLTVEGYRTEAMRKNKLSLEKELNELRILIAKKRSPQHIKIKAEEMGLAPVQRIEFLSFEKNNSIVLGNE